MSAWFTKVAHCAPVTVHRWAGATGSTMHRWAGATGSTMHRWSGATGSTVHRWADAAGITVHRSAVTGASLCQIALLHSSKGVPDSHLG
jgi:hypothetical protein